MPDAIEQLTPDLARLEAAAFIDARGVTARVPRLEQYFGPWAILEDHLRASVARFNALNLNLHIEAHAASSLKPQASSLAAAGGARGYQLSRGGVAVIDMAGPMMKGESSLGQTCSTIAARQAIRQAAADEECSAILLRIDSPGGTISGTDDLAKAIQKAAAAKPCWAYCEDLCCSAAYWAASQCSKVFANSPTCLIGSIGAYMVLEDSSQAAEEAGVKVHVIKSGAYKGTGIEGTEVTEDQLDEMQQMIDGLNEHFVRAVAAGRKMTLAAAREVNDGRAYLAAEAQKKGLIDGVQSFDDTLAQLSSKKQRAGSKEQRAETNPQPSALGSPPSDPSTTSSQSGAKNMATETADAKGVAATYAQLKAACIGADAAFIVAQQEAGATIDEARANWSAHQASELAKVKAENEQLKAQAAKPGVSGGPKAGSKRSGEGQSEAQGDPIAEFNAAVDGHLADFAKRRLHANKPAHKQRAEAIALVVAADPELHRAYLDAYRIANDKQKAIRAAAASSPGNRGW